jgi:protein-S-isoprenylcysteine O-methyltransferase Ste14
MGTTWEQSLAFVAIIPIGATIYFFVFWTLFDFWRRHRLLTYAFMASTFVAVGATTQLLEHWRWFGGRLPMPQWVQSVGWGTIAFATIFGWVADRQIGFRVRSFTPFFQRHGHIELKTTGAYGVVRHPIYAAGRVFQFGVFLVTGYPSVLVAWAIFGFGAIWFTRQEERRLIALLDDPNEYERYRERVPALFPLLRKSSA